MELFRLQKLFPKRAAGRILLGAFFDHKENIEAGWVWGACFMFRRELPAQMPDGKLDEEFFMYYEDMQWCLDIRRLGYRVHFCADAEVVHLMGGSSANKEHLMAINREKFLKKNFSPIRVLFIKTLANLLRA
jgi:GT2 family glycosyltransferase